MQVMIAVTLALFKFQYDNTLSQNVDQSFQTEELFKFQYDNTLSC